MIENQVDKKEQQQRSWLDLLAMVLAFFTAIISFLGALVTYLTQAQIPEAPLWPLPGLVLVDWVLLGSIGFFAVYLCFRHTSVKWLLLAWFITGTLIPLIILGAFSIGLAVLIAFFLFVISTIILTIRQKGKWINSFAWLMLGSICNLGILFIIITLSQ
ncbi:MAG: hypothetical protein A2Z71_11140 [Chloroflexi bacterium RBG_13_50_21]|nr:MAG: hypothetical protein A2Z71_11140 [Chloroflexi bacterium RBG_13_50_21]